VLFIFNSPFKKSRTKMYKNLLYEGKKEKKGKKRIGIKDKP